MATASRRGIVAALLTAPAVSAPAVLVASAPDPVFAALAAEKAAEDRWCALGDWPREPGPARDAAVRAWDQEGDRYFAIVRATMATVPTTTAGLVALVDRFEASVDGSLVDSDRDGLNELLATVRAFADRQVAS